MRKLKVTRPTLKAAHEYLTGSVLGVTGTITEEEHHQEVVEIDEDLRSIVRAQFPRTQNLEYAILKAHLIVEHSISQFIRSFAHTTDAKTTRFSFSQKLDIAYLLGFGAHDSTMIPTVELLNRVRNQVAHSFSIDRSLVDELLRINSEDYPIYKPKDDRERIRSLRLMCGFVAGYICGHIWGHYFFDQEGRRNADKERGRTTKAKS